MIKINDGINEQGREGAHEECEKKDGALLETENTEVLDTEQGKSVGPKEADNVLQIHTFTEERLSSQEVAEKVDREMPDAQVVVVQDTRVENLSDIDMNEHQAEEKVCHGQEIAEETSEVPDDTRKGQDHTEAVQMPSGLNELSDSLEVSKEKQDEMGTFLGEQEDLKKKSAGQTVVVTRTEEEEKHEKSSQDLDEKRETPVEPVPKSYKLDKDKIATEEHKNVEKTSESHLEIHSKTKDHEEDRKGNPENNTSGIDLIHDACEAERTEEHKISEIDGHGNVEEAIMEHKQVDRCSPSAGPNAGNRSVTGEKKLESPIDDEMETTRLESSQISTSNVIDNVNHVINEDATNRKDESMSDMCVNIAEPEMLESQITSNEAAKDQSVTEHSKTIGSYMQSGMEELTANGGDQQKMLEQIMTEVRKMTVHLGAGNGNFMYI